ncbi:MAG: T9SS type A sorting domain-containing protein [Ignavibacteriae bacterium]|nr:T9SS type A sorting domain-containing protein [Ignavibacteriota bacterium]
MKLLIYLIVGFLTWSTLFSQVWLEPFLNRDDVKLSEIQALAESHFDTIDITQKGSGFKQYKRFEWFWKDRLMPDGSFPDAGILLKEKLKFKQNMDTKNNKVQSSNSWKVLGPFTSSGGYSGLARVNCVRKNPHNGDIWAGLPAGGIWLSTNNGTSWSTNTDNEDVITALGITSIAFHPTNSNIVYAASGDGDGTNTYSLGVLKSTDGGSNWKTTGLSWNITQYRTINKLLINPTNPNILYTAGSYGIHKSTDGGDTWSRVKTGNFKDMEFKPNSPNTLYAAGTDLWKSTDAGTNWNELTNGFPTSGIRRIALAVSKNNVNALYALVGNSNGNNLKGVYLSTNSGDSFSEIADSTPNMMGYKKDGNDTKGQVWYDLCIEADQDDWERVILGGINLWRTTDKGTSWEISSMWSGNHNDVTTVHADQHDLWYDDVNNVMYVGNDGGVYKSSDFGENWDWIGSGILGTQFYRFGISQIDSTVYIGGAQDNGTKVHKSDGTWRDAIGGDGFECLIDNNDKNTMYGSLYYGDFFKSTNGGNNFKRINDLDNNNNYDDITESGAWSTPFIQNPKNSNTILIGMINVWISRDKGDHFTKISNFGGSNKLVSIAMSESDSNYIYAAYNTKLYRTTNSGTSWTEMTRPGNSNISYIFLDDKDKDKLWVTNSGYSTGNKVFESTDGGSTWSNISKNLPNVPALTVIKQKDTDDKLWVGTDIGVYYIDDNISDWVAYNTDLPNVIVTELEINYTYNEIYAATYGRGIWKAEIPSALSVPTFIEPNANSFGNTINSLVIDWTDINDADEYVIQVSKDVNFSTLVAIDTVVVSKYIISNLNNFTEYFVRVKAKSTHSQSNWTPTHKFTTIVSKVSLISPTNNAIAKDTADNLSWAEVLGKTEYQIQIATDDNFNTVLIDQNSNSEQYNYNSLDYFTDYWWRVRAKDPSGTNGDWSFIRKFQTKVDKPILVSPQDQSTKLEISQTLDWSDVLGADKYTVQLSDKSDFSSLILNKTITGTQESVNNLNHFTKYYWRVVAENNNKKGNWSNVFNFKTNIEKSSLVSPPNNSINLNLSETLTWEDVPYADNYEVQIDTKNTFDSPNLFVSTPTQNRRSFDNLLNDTIYYWRTRIKANNEFGDWSEIWNFRTKLKEPSLIKPDNNLTKVEFIDTLEWSNSAPTSAYKVQISKSPNFNSFVVDETINVNEYQFSGLNDYEVYYWRIKAIRGQFQSDWSEVFRFTTKLGLTILINPENQSINLDTNLSFTWENKDYADKYTIQISTDNLFSNPSLINTIENNNIHYEFGLLYDTTYYWRTKVHQGTDESEWSETFNFRTKLEKPELISPAIGSTEVPLLGKLEWNKLAINSQSRVQISLNSDFSTNLIDQLVPNNSFSYNNLQDDKKYYWRVKSQRGSFESDWSEVFNFNTPVTIDRPQLDSPPNNQKNIEASLLSLKWSKLDNITNYRIQVAEDNNFQSLIIDKSDLTSNNFDFSQLEFNKIYYWRVKGIRSGGNESEWSEVWLFSTILPTPILELPLNNSTDINLTSKLEWESIEGANKYNVQVASDNQFINKISELSKEVTTNYIDINGLDEEKTYFWRVNSKSDIALSNWSEIWSFTTSKTISFVTAIESVASIKITPNPINENAEIQLDMIESCNVHIYLTDVNGKFINSIEKGYMVENQSKTLHFKRGNLSSGIYFINLNIKDKFEIIKIIIN